MNWNAVAAVATVFAALVPLFVLLERRKSSRPRIRVSIKTGFVAQGASLAGPVFFIDALNSSQHSLNINYAGIELSNSNKSWIPVGADWMGSWSAGFGGVRFPLELLSHSNCQVIIDYRDLATGLWNQGYRGETGIRGFYSDFAGKRHYSKSVRFPIERWIGS